MNGAPMRLTLLALVVALGGLMTPCALAQADDPLASGPAWQPPVAKDVETQALAWLAEAGADEPARAKAAAIWADLNSQPGDTEVLDCLARTFALADANAAALVELCSAPKSQVVLPDQSWLADPKTPPFVADNLRLLYGRWLVQESLYDEALEQLAGLRPTDVVAPACLLFHQGVVHHRLLDEREVGLEAIEQLLAGSERSPVRYVDLAYLMQQDLEGLEDDSLDHIARRMEDIRRRLDLGRAGQKVRGVEDGVIASLDKLIKEAEQQQQQQQQQSSAGGSSIRSMAPAGASAPLGGRGRGDTTNRALSDEGGWGDLPPKEREAILQQIGRDFPSHYRDVIEEYYRRLAAEGGE